MRSGFLHKNIALGGNTELSLDSGRLCNEVLVDMVADMSSIYLLGSGAQEKNHFAEATHDGSIVVNV